MFYQYNSLKYFPKIINRNVSQFFLFEKFWTDCYLNDLHLKQIPKYQIIFLKYLMTQNYILMCKCQSIIEEYEHFRNRVKKGEFGKTAQFWVLYLYLVKNQYFAHIAVRSNNFDLRLFAWKYMIPFFFVLSKINFARYESFYTESMRNIEKLYPNLKPLLETKCLSVQGQDRYAMGTSIDQRGEQTIN